jgi:hypothetical protein
LLNRDGSHADEGSTTDAVFPATQSGWGSQRLLGIGLVLGQDLPEGIVAEVLMIVEILIASGDGKDALGQQSALGMGDAVGVAGIGDTAVQGVKQSQTFVGLAEQEHSGVGREGSAGEIGVEASATETGKGEPRRLHSVIAVVLSWMEGRL